MRQKRHLGYISTHFWHGSRPVVIGPHTKCMTSMTSMPSTARVRARSRAQYGYVKLPLCARQEVVTGTTQEIETQAGLSGIVKLTTAAFASGAASSALRAPASASGLSPQECTRVLLVLNWPIVRLLLALLYRIQYYKTSNKMSRKMFTVPPTCTDLGKYLKHHRGDTHRLPCLGSSRRPSPETATPTRHLLHASDNLPTPRKYIIEETRRRDYLTILPS